MHTRTELVELYCPEYTGRGDQIGHGIFVHGLRGYNQLISSPFTLVIVNCGEKDPGTVCTIFNAFVSIAIVRSGQD